jgi:hypothetical protein
MIACDFDLNITFISCGWEGSATDARVLSSAILKGFQVPNGKFYFVDGGYANTQSFLAPYRGVQYHLKEWGHGRRRPQNHKGTLDGVTPDLKVKCYDLFKCVTNCEIFINVVAEKDGSALAWLQSKIGTLRIGVHTNLFFACFSYFDF